MTDNSKNVLVKPSEKEDISDEKMLIPEDPQTNETTSLVQVSNEESEELVNEMNIFGIDQREDIGKPKKKVPLFSQKKNNTRTLIKRRKLII